MTTRLRFQKKFARKLHSCIRLFTRFDCYVVRNFSSMLCICVLFFHFFLVLMSFRPKTARFCDFYFFFLAYIISNVFYLLHDDVTKTSAISLHPTRDLGFAHHQCPYMAVCGLHSASTTDSWERCKQTPPLTVWLLPLPSCLVGHTCLALSARTRQRQL